MPLHHNNQADGSAAMDMNSGDAVRSLTRSRKQVALKYDGSLWSINRHEGLGYVPYPITATTNYYIPPFSVRSINICDDVEAIRKICYDEAGDGDRYKETTVQARLMFQINIIETFAANILIPVHLTKLHLNAFTTATEIHLHG